MKFLPYPLFLSALLLLLTAAPAQSQDRPTDMHNDLFHEIDRDFREGKIALDQKVLYKLYASKKIDKLPSEYQQEDNDIMKCGTPAISDFQNKKSQLSPATVSKAESLIGSPSMQASETYPSPDGYFTIHYETTGTHAVPSEDSDSNGIPDYVEVVANAADSSYRHEVQNLGYTDPLATKNKIDVYILNLPGIYGQSNGISIEIENDFAEGFPPNDDPDGHRAGAAKVTMAHELKHVIQFSASQWQGEIFNWLEMDATLMEEVVFDNVNDYYNYIRNDQSIFNDPEQSFYPGTYYHVSWALYFEERFGSQFWVDVWETIKNDPEILMVDALTQNLGGPTSFNHSYIESQLWHYASGPANSRPDFGFEESDHYPSPVVATNANLYNENFAIPRSSPLTSPSGFSAKYFDVALQNNLNGKLMLEAASQGESNGAGFIVYFKDGSATSTTLPLSENRSSFEMPDFSWDNIDRLGLVVTNSSISSTDTDPVFVSVGSNEFENTLNQNYPNPFNPSTKIRFTLEENTHVELRVYDSAGRLVKKLIDEELSPGLYEPTFDGSNLASGVYLYQLVTDNQQIVKKMTLIK